MKIISVCMVISMNWLISVNSIENPEITNKTTSFIVKPKDDSMAKGLNKHKMARHISNIWTNDKQDKGLLLLEQVLEDIEKGRGKSHKHKKFTKMMYPLFMGILIAKIVLIPLILKMLTAISAAALVMSKIALITTGFMALKWIFSGVVHDGKDRFEIIYFPTPANGKPYRSASGGFSLWDDQSWADSNAQYAVASATASSLQQQKYIPVNLKHQQPYNLYHHKGGVSTSGLSDAVNDLYYYAQHNYNNNYNKNDGKPFL